MFQLFPSSIRVRIEFPALDRLLDFLESDQQKQVDAAVEQLNKSGDALAGAIEKEGGGLKG